MDSLTYVEEQKNILVNLIKCLNQKGWSPATSTNYSFREHNSNRIWISESGIDKSFFTEDNLIPVDENGEIIISTDSKVSAETLLHTTIYNFFSDKEICAVVHTHSVYNTILSDKYLTDKQLIIQGLEIQKAISGVFSPDEPITIPIFKNTNNMQSLSKELKNYLQVNFHCKGFLISGHGFYTWGKDILEAKKHIEAFEFMFETIYKTILIK